MAISEQLILDLSQAQRQIDDLERQLDSLIQPIDIPVNIGSDEALDQLRREIRAADADDVDVDVDVQGDEEIGDLNRELRRTEAELEDVAREADDATTAVLRVGTRGASVFSNLRGSLLAVGAAFAVFQGLQAVTRFFGESIEAASDLEESTSKAQVVFGDFFDDIENFASTAPQALGLANSAALEFSGTFGNLFVALGLTQEAAANLAPEIVQLGSDLASFNNLEVTDALEKLRAGLVGEAEPLRALGVNLNAAAVEAKALELGLAGSTGEIDDAAKVQARYALIVEQTATAQGDFARTSEGIANRQRTLAGEFENVRAEIGEALLPAFETLLEVAPALLEQLGDLAPVIADLSQSFANATEGGGSFVNVLGDIPNVVGGVIDVFRGGGNAILNFSQAAFDLVTLDFGGFAGNIREALGALADLQVDIDLRTIREDLLDLLAAGEDPVAVLTAGVAEVGQSTSNLERFGDELDRIFAITGLDGAEAAEGLRFLVDNAEDLGLSADEVAIILDRLTTSLQENRDAALLARPEIGNFADEVEQLPTTLIPAGEAVDGMARQLEALENVDISGAIEEIEAQFAQLPDGLDAAAAALRTEENEIVTDFTDFLDDLDDQIAARQAFRDNLAILESLGLDQLAQVFRDEGLEAAAALADAVANPAEAQRAEELLDEEARNIAQSFRETLAAEIQSGALDLTVPVNINAAIQSLTSSGLGAQQAVEVVGASGAGPNVGGGVTVTQNFEAGASPTTETARASQIASSIISRAE